MGLKEIFLTGVLGVWGINACLLSVLFIVAHKSMGREDRKFLMLFWWCC